MNKYDERYDIRLARYDEIDKVMEFIDKYWKKNHIMARDRKLFEYEFLDGDEVNVMIAIDKSTNTIEAMSGFLKASSNTHTPDIWGSIWKVNNQKSNMTFLGEELVKRIAEYTNCRNYLGIGINKDTTLPIRKKAFHEKIDKMAHYYMLNSNITQYCIAEVYELRENQNISIDYDVNEIHDISYIKSNFVFNENVIPYKDVNYIEKRFFKHPYYIYHIYGIKDENKKMIAFFVGRFVEQNNSKIFRIVDYYGDDEGMKGVGNFMKSFMQENNLEYIDMYEFGMNDKALVQAGFVQKSEDDKNIIPNYFSPFIRENIDIYIRYNDDSTRFFKADGDQDRPN